MRLGDGGCAVLVAEQVVLPYREQPHHRLGHGHGFGPPGQRPHRAALRLDFLQRLARALETALRVGEGDLAPVGEVARGGGAVGCEEPAGEPGVALLAVEQLVGGGDHEGLLLLERRDHREDPAQRGDVEEPVDARASLAGIKAGRDQQLAGLGAGQGPPLQAPAQQVELALDRRFVHAELPEAGHRRAQRPLGQQRAHPAQVLGGEQVDRVAHQPGPADLAVGRLGADGLRRQPLDPRAQRQRRCRCVLGLDREARAGGGRDRLRLAAGQQALGAQPQQAKLSVGDLGRHAQLARPTEVVRRRRRARARGWARAPGRRTRAARSAGSGRRTSR